MKGISLVPGLAIGRLCILTSQRDFCVHHFLADDKEIQAELTKLDWAIDKAKHDLEEIVCSLRDSLNNEELEIFTAHQWMLADPVLKASIVEKITKEKRDCIWSVELTIEEIAQQFSCQADDYFRERAADVRDIGQRIQDVLLARQEMQLDVNNGILVAKELTPSQTLDLYNKKILGIATEKGGPTSHAAIIAKALGIPLVSGLTDLVKTVSQGDTAILDGHDGLLIVNPDQAEIDAYCRKKTKQLDSVADERIQKAITLDGREIKVAANIGRVEDLPRALASGADGVGLFRTEFLYMNRTEPPDEEEQYAIYQQVLAAFGDKPVIIRTLDAGGDKPISYIKRTIEDNPFLGLRGIRFSLTEKSLFCTQLRALLRAAVQGNLKIMFPLVTKVAEIIEAKKQIQSVYDKLYEQGIDCRLPQEIGVMIEVPGAAMIADSLIAEVDFFSIGTNDLTQYTLAVDRGNAAVADLYDAYHPAVLRLIKQTVNAAVHSSKWTGVCGEFAGEAEALPLLVGLGLHELSASPAFIPRLKNQITKLSYQQLQLQVDELLNCHSGAEVRLRLAHLEANLR